MTDDPRLPILILGAGRQGRNVAALLRVAGRPVLGFLDDTKEPHSLVDGIEVLGGFRCAEDETTLSRAAIHVAIGNPVLRARIAQPLLARGARTGSAVHPSAVVSAHARLGPGLYVAPFVRIAPGARIDEGCLVESHCSIGVEVILEAFTMLAPLCSLTAGSRVGARSFLGTGTMVCGAAIGRACVIGAGSVVVRDIPDGMRAFGQPARVVGPVDPNRPPV